MRNWLKHCQICLAQPSLFVPYRNYLFFFEYIRNIRSLRTRLVTLNCILSQRDRRRSSRERGLQASPRPFLGLFLGLFFFLSFDPTPCSESGPRASSPLFRATDFLVQIFSCGTAPRHSERRILFFDLPLFSLRLFCLLLSSTPIC